MVARKTRLLKYVHFVLFILIELRSLPCLAQQQQQQHQQQITIPQELSPTRRQLLSPVQQPTKEGKYGHQKRHRGRKQQESTPTTTSKFTNPNGQCIVTPHILNNDSNTPDDMSSPANTTQLQQETKIYIVGILAIRGFEKAYLEFEKTFSTYLTSTAGSRFSPPIQFQMKPLDFLLLFSDVEDLLVDFIYVNPSAYSCIESEYGANSLVSQISRRVVGGVEYELTKFGGVIFTKAERDDIKGIKDLRGKIVACASISGLGSGQMQFREMARAGLSFLQDVKQMVFTSNQGKVVNGVLRGDFDVGFVRTDQLERSIDVSTGELVDLKLLKLIDPQPNLEIDGIPFPFQSSTPLYPEWNVAVLGHVPDEVSREVQSALLALSDHAIIGAELQKCYKGKNCSSNNLFVGGEEEPCQQECLSQIDNSLYRRCDTTPTIALQAQDAKISGKYSGFRTALSYMELRNMQEETGFISREEDESNKSGGTVTRCVRSAEIYDAIVCPSGHFRKKEEDVLGGCESLGLKCKELDEKFQCLCSPCVEAFDVDVFQIEVREDEGEDLSPRRADERRGCERFSICGKVTQRSVGMFHAVDNRKRPNMTLTLNVLEGEDSYDMQATALGDFVYEFQLETMKSRVGTMIVQIFADGKQISESPLRVRVNAPECEEHSLRVPSSHGLCVCKNGSVEIGGKCVTLSVLLPTVMATLIIITCVGVYLYIDRKRKQADMVWAVQPEEIQFDDPPEIVGRGTFGLVLLAEYRGTEVAVKRVIPPKIKKKTVILKGDATSSERYAILGKGAESSGGGGKSLDSLLDERKESWGVTSKGSLVPADWATKSNQSKPDFGLQSQKSTGGDLISMPPLTETMKKSSSMGNLHSQNKTDQRKHHRHSFDEYHDEDIEVLNKTNLDSHQPLNDRSSPQRMRCFSFSNDRDLEQDQQQEPKRRRSSFSTIDPNDQQHQQRLEPTNTQSSPLDVDDMTKQHHSISTGATSSSDTFAGLPSVVPIHDRQQQRHKKRGSDLSEENSFSVSSNKTGLKTRSWYFDFDRRRPSSRRGSEESDAGTTNASNIIDSRYHHRYPQDEEDPFRRRSDHSRPILQHALSVNSEPLTSSMIGLRSGALHDIMQANNNGSSGYGNLWAINSTSKGLESSPGRRSGSGSWSGSGSRSRAMGFLFRLRRNIFGPRDEYTRLKSEFIVEMRHLSKLRHPCITTVMGAVIDKRHEPMLVMEYMNHGSLYDILHNSSMVLEGEIVLPILRDIAQGVRFLHAASPQVIHGDLKAQNVLVDAKFRAKVADFGLTQKKRVGATGTPLWMAPELLRGETENNAATDVYSFGIILYEVYSRKEPYEGEDHMEVLRQVVDIKVNKRPPVPKCCPPMVASLMSACLRANPVGRPTFDELDVKLKHLNVDNVEPEETNWSRQSKRNLVTDLRSVAEKNEDLLFNVFPRHVAEALRDGRKVEPESRDCVTVFFSDIVGYTTLCSKLHPLKVSDMLDRLYSKFDKLAHLHDVFKVETIGDAYMAITNLAKDQEDHVALIAKFAVDAVLAARDTLIDPDEPSLGSVHIRAGFHSGPVVANVVGSRMPKYTIFGDTVNTAARMESNSMQGRVQCSDRSALMLKALREKSVKIISRGTINVKGKGEMETFWVVNDELLKVYKEKSRDAS